MPSPMLINLKHEAEDLGVDFNVDHSGLEPPEGSGKARKRDDEDDGSDSDTVYLTPEPEDPSKPGVMLTILLHKLWGSPASLFRLAGICIHRALQPNRKVKGEPPKSTIKFKSQGIHTHSNGTTAPSQESFPALFAMLYLHTYIHTYISAW